MVRDAGGTLGAGCGVGRYGPAGFVGDAVFVAVATLGLALVGWAFSAGSGGGFGIGEPSILETLPAWGVVAFEVWMVLIAVASLLLPAAAIAVFWRHEAVRRTLLPYVLVLVAQIAVEVSLSAAFAPNIVVLTGLVFTVYRLWRLSGSRRRFAAAPLLSRPARASVGALLSLGLVLWTANLAFLLLVAIPRAVAVS